MSQTNVFESHQLDLNSQEEGGLLDVLKVEQDIEFLGGSCDMGKAPMFSSQDLPATCRDTLL